MENFKALAYRGKFPILTILKAADPLTVRCGRVQIERSSWWPFSLKPREVVISWLEWTLQNVLHDDYT